MRPRFAVEVSCEVETLVAMLEEDAARADPPLEGHFDPGHCVLRIPEARRAFWSPELDLTFERVERDAGGAPASHRVRCLFAPRPAVWTGFAFVFAVLFAAGVVGVLYGLAQLTLGEPPIAFWAVPAAGALAALTYASSFIGQGLSLSQMYEMRRVLDQSLQRAEERAGRVAREPMRP
ncbi:MAG: hypothetical protein HKP30_07985 [Myxococcales bacterium]|nr:hypothetical protein [Myxococcales bacterium]